MRQQVTSWLRKADRHSVMKEGNSMGCEITKGNADCRSLQDTCLATVASDFFVPKLVLHRLETTLPLSYGEAFYFTGERK